MKAIDLLIDAEDNIEAYKAMKKAAKAFIKEYGETQLLDVMQDELGDYVLYPITHEHDTVQ